MEFDLDFFSQKGSKLTARIRPTTLEQLKAFADFYGVSLDQVVDAALSKLFVADQDFVEYLVQPKTGSTTASALNSPQRTGRT